MDTNSFRTIEVERVVGMPEGCLNSLRQRGFCGPELPRGRWSRRQIKAVAVLRAARRQGSTLVASVAAYDLIHRMTPEAMEAHLEAGRRFLVLLGESIILRPVDRDRAFSDDLRHQAMKDQLPLVIVDLVQVGAVVDERIENLRDDGGENFPGQTLTPISLKSGRQTRL